MKTVWVIKDKGRVIGAPGYWTGVDLSFTHNIDDAVQFMREVDARRILDCVTLLNGHPVEKAIE